jgi:hypothetical protein
MAVNPAVTRQPAAQTVYAGEAATFTAWAFGNTTPAVQWQVSGDGGEMFTNLPGADAMTLSFAAQQSNNGQLYRAIFTTTANGMQTQTATHAVLLTVRTPSLTPVIITEPSAQTVLAGQTVSFTAAAVASPGLSIQWQSKAHGAKVFTDITGANSATLTFIAASSDNGNDYRAVFSNSLEKPATMVPTVPATLILGAAPVVTLQPLSQTSAIGKKITFRAAASAFPLARVQWQVSTDGGATYSDIAGATSTSLTLTAQPAQADDFYRAIFTNAVGRATSNSAALIISA